MMPCIRVRGAGERERIPGREFAGELAMKARQNKRILQLSLDIAISRYNIDTT